MQQLTCATLKPGDLLLKLNAGSFVNRLIAFGQMGSLNRQIVHAAIMFDPIYCIEASGGGLHANDLRVGNLNYGYLVYRPTNPQIAAGAATCAKMLFDIHGAAGGVGYNYKGAATAVLGGGTVKTSADFQALLDRILAGQDGSMYCSQFAVFTYQFVAEQSGIDPKKIFNVSDERVTPAKLSSLLINSPAFSEAGYLMAGAR